LLRELHGCRELGARFLSVKHHENVRVNVVNLLRDVLKEILEEEYRLTKDLKTWIALKLIESPDITLIIPQEVYASPTERKSIDMAFGNKVIFELKSGEDEFDQAFKDAKEKYLGKPATREAEFFIVTNYDKWRIYKIIDGRDLQLIFAGGVDEAKSVLRQIVSRFKELKLYPLPESVVRLYTIDIDDILSKLKEVFNTMKEDPRVKPLYEAYRSIMQMLYGEASDTFLEDLFVRHTYMHMAVIASLTLALGKIGRPEDVASGSLLEIDVAQPYLNWWRIALGKQETSGATREILGEVVSRASLVDWRAGLTEDVFRALYEELIDPETRRRIGEYYTPLWLVDFILDHFNLRDKSILDPFCGSGTFLVRAFHRKVDQGEDVDKAFDSLIGYDVNPLAVAVTRAELIIAYRRRAGKEPKNPPHIYHADTFAMWFGEEQFLPDEVKKLVVAARNYLDVLVNFNGVKVGNIAEGLSLVEKLITSSLRYSFAECGTDEKCLEERIAYYMDELSRGAESSFVKAFLQHSKEAHVPSRLTNLITKYGGNDVWGLVMSSIYAPILLTRFKPDIIVTNPPWVPLTEYKAPYIENISDYMLDNVKKIIGEKKAGQKARQKAGQVVIGSDIAAAALGKSLEVAKESVAYIMNREQLFYHKASSAGTLASYCIIKNSRVREAVLYDMDFDVFEHGMYPAVIIARKDTGEEKPSSSAGFKLYIVKLKEDAGSRYSKRLTLDEVRSWLEIREYGKMYEEYIRPAELYFKEDINRLARALQVDRIVPKGLYIMGVYGGEKKRGAASYAGLILDSFAFKGGVFEFKLHNISKPVNVPQSMLEKYGVKVYEVIYEGESNPFRLRRTLSILLSKISKKKLKEFLNNVVLINEKELPSEDIEKIRGLAEEAEQPSKIETLDTNKWYVIYRCDRAFTAFAFKPDKERIIASSTVGYLEISSEEENKAYYYAAILNYLAYHVVRKGRDFRRHQYARPLLAIYEAGLLWNNVDEATRSRVVELSKVLHEKAPNKEYSNQKAALKEVSKLPEFGELVDVLDKVVNEEKLEEALDLVSGKGKESED